MRTRKFPNNIQIGITPRIKRWYLTPVVNSISFSNVDTVVLSAIVLSWFVFYRNRSDYSMTVGQDMFVESKFDDIMNQTFIQQVEYAALDCVPWKLREVYLFKVTTSLGTRSGSKAGPHPRRSIPRQVLIHASTSYKYTMHFESNVKLFPPREAHNCAASVQLSDANDSILLSRRKLCPDQHVAAAATAAFSTAAEANSSRCNWRVLGLYWRWKKKRKSIHGCWDFFL